MRETFEETGLRLAAPSAPSEDPGSGCLGSGCLGSWRGFLEDGAAPAAPREEMRRKRGHVDIIYAGQEFEDTSGFLDGQEFADLLEKARNEYDMVLCDVPPVMAAMLRKTCAPSASSAAVKPTV